MAGYNKGLGSLSLPLLLQITLKGEKDMSLITEKKKEILREQLRLTVLKQTNLAKSVDQIKSKLSSIEQQENLESLRSNSF